MPIRCAIRRTEGTTMEILRAVGRAVAYCAYLLVLYVMMREDSLRPLVTYAGLCGLALIPAIVRGRRPGGARGRPLPRSGGT
jgi:hypothetical protein